MACSIVIATSSTVVGAVGLHPPTGSIGLRQGGATSTYSSAEPGGSKTVAVYAPGFRCVRPPRSQPAEAVGTNVKVSRAAVPPVGTISAVAGRAGAPASRTRIW